ncbi:MAG TPA: GNAT family N-acetyltransferase [Trebonia sp.]|nr:GNAT family N-acetyltransferase [Trebonia sp.]
MTDVEIRPLGPDDDMDAQVDLGQRAYGAATPAVWADWRERAAALVSDGAFLGAFVAGRPVGAAAFHDMRQWWHGKPMPMAGVSSVKIAPEFRGRGLGRRLMTELLNLIAARGYPVSALYPATMPVYRSLGWELAGGRYQMAVPSRELRALLAPDDAATPVDATPLATATSDAVEVRRATPGDAAAVTAVIGEAHAATHASGPLTWNNTEVEGWLARDDLYTYLAADGFLAYRWHNDDRDLHVDRLVAASPATYRALWSVVASHSSTAGTVHGRFAPDDPLPWLVRERDVAITKRSMWMLRVVDAPAAIAARGFPPAMSCSVPLVVTDAIRPSNSGRWELTVADGQGALTMSAGGPGAAPSTLTMGARGFAALYAGTPVAALKFAGLAAGGSPWTDAVLDAAFAGTGYLLDDF